KSPDLMRADRTIAGAHGAQQNRALEKRGECDAESEDDRAARALPPCLEPEERDERHRGDAGESAQSEGSAAQQKQPLCGRNENDRCGNSEQPLAILKAEPDFEVWR